MVRDLDAARELCEIPDGAAERLASAEAPILLLPRREGAPVADAVAPALRCLGVMLPSSPLHHALLAALDFPVVATSGNLSEEPICTDEREALDRLAGSPICSSSTTGRSRATSTTPWPVRSGERCA